jgi:hypothetical protein
VAKNLSLLLTQLIHLQLLLKKWWLIQLLISQQILLLLIQLLYNSQPEKTREGFRFLKPFFLEKK